MSALTNRSALVAAIAMIAGVLYLARGAGIFSAPNPGTGASGGDTVAPGAEPGLAQQFLNIGANTVTNPTTLSPQGLDQLKRAEGFSATAYPDAGGNSIGFGHYIKAGEEWLLGAVVSDAQASELLAGDVGWAERAVSASVSVPLTQAQFDALVLLCYNIGETAFKSSTLVALLNEGDYAGAADQFARWNRSEGQVNSALVLRRAQEQALFAGGTYV